MIPDLIKSLFLYKFRRYFKVKQKLGEGGFGKVYLVTRKGDSKQLAAKRLDKSRISHHAQTKTGLIPLEIHCMNGLRHPHVIQVQGYLETRYHWLILMEHLPASVDLFELILHRDYLSEDLAQDIFLQLHSAVSYCLSQGIDHRDLKDENILIDLTTHQIKLIDFGSATRYHKGVPYTYGRGTSIFLPPEFYLTGSYHALPATVWAYGCLVYKMVIGYHPFLDRIEIVSYNPKYPTVSAECRDFLRQSLAKDPQDRVEYRALSVHSWCSADLRELHI